MSCECFLKLPIECNNCSGTDDGGRIKLTEDTIVYVRKDGSDDNDGRIDSAEGAFLTVQAAIDSLMRFDAQKHSLTVMVHEGTYEEAIHIGAYLASVGASALEIVNDEGEEVCIAAPPAEKVGDCVLFAEYPVTITGVTLQSNGSAVIQPAAMIKAHCIMTLENCILRDYTGCSYLVAAPTASAIVVKDCGVYTSNKFGTSSIFTAFQNGCINLVGTITNLDGFGCQVYIQVVLGGVVKNDAAFAGSVSGRKYLVTYNSVLITSGVTIPGSTAGTSNTGGVVG